GKGHHRNSNLASHHPNR
ncbi:hypothetical protein TNIN_289461, partial [Trichonephila inaurata madagascariensis]